MTITTLSPKKQFYRFSSLGKKLLLFFSVFGPATITAMADNDASGVATYAVVPQLPEALRDHLPSPEAIAERLRLWEGKEPENE